MIHLPNTSNLRAKINKNKHMILLDYVYTSHIVNYIIVIVYNFLTILNNTSNNLQYSVSTTYLSRQNTRVFILRKKTMQKKAIFLPPTSYYTNVITQ